jgi:2-phosphosulfolactate phosphatase
MIEAPSDSPGLSVTEHAHAQRGFDVRFDWGADGLRVVGADAAVVIVVDVLSFTTAVDIVGAAGAAVVPVAAGADAADGAAERPGAVVAAERGSETDDRPYSLSPASLVGIPRGTTLVLPSPNGSALAAAAAATGAVVLAACLRNAGAVASACRTLDGPVAVVAAGERHAGGGLRPALEDLAGAGAVVGALAGTPSPEARAAAAAAAAIGRNDLEECASARELRARGYAADLALAFADDASDAVPRLAPDAAFR